MTHVSLFTGIGGIDLAAEWAGFDTVLQVERDPYCLKVLAKHWPDVPRLTDVKEVTSESVSEPVTVVSGGFPCQPFSAAGKRGGTSDDRHLWPQMLRIVRELHPLYVVGENVSGLLSIDGGLVFETVCADLERAGYDVLPLHYPAASVGAPHRRDRVFIVAHANSAGGSGGVVTRKDVERDVCFAPQLRDREGQAESDVAHSKRDGRRPRRAERQGQQGRAASIGAGGNVADTDEPRPQGRDSAELRERAGEQSTRASGTFMADTESGEWDERLDGIGREKDCEGGIRSEVRASDWWQSEPAVGRVAHGIPARVDRLRALGNAVVPAQAYPVFAAIAQAEAMTVDTSREMW